MTYVELFLLVILTVTCVLTALLWIRYVRLQRVFGEQRRNLLRAEGEIHAAQQREESLLNSIRQLQQERQEARNDDLGLEAERQDLARLREGIAGEKKSLKEASEKLEMHRVKLERELLRVEKESLRLEATKAEIDVAQASIARSKEDIARERIQLGALEEKLKQEAKGLVDEREQLNLQQTELDQKRLLFEVEVDRIERAKRELDALQTAVSPERLELDAASAQLKIDEGNVAILAKGFEESKTENMKQFVMNLVYAEKEKQRIAEERIRLEADRRTFEAERAAHRKGLLESEGEEDGSPLPGEELIREDQMEPKVRLPLTVLDFGDVPEDVSESPEESDPSFSNTEDQATEATLQIDPAHRGGRPRGSGEEAIDKPEMTRVSIRPRINVVCIKKGWSWGIGLELPDESDSYENIQVRQGNEFLERETSHEALWLLKERTHELLLQWIQHGENMEAGVTLDLNRLVFKLEGERERGRLVRNVSHGSYIAFAPANWMRDDFLAGLPRTQAENTDWEGFMAHYFDFEPGEAAVIAFRSEDGESKVLSKKLELDLVGNRIMDASETAGQLFGGLLPSLRSSTPNSIPLIRTLVVGEEGEGTKRWRAAFPWISESSIQTLPEEIAHRGAGWYFIRLYDGNDCLIDSIDFRYVPGLHSVTVKHGPTQHLEWLAEVEFVHDASCSVFPVEGLSANAPVETFEGKTVAKMVTESMPQDLTHWVIEAQGSKILLSLDISQVSWNLCDNEKEPGQWQRHPIWLPRDQFKATGSYSISVWLPRAYHHKSVRVGFSRYKSQHYRLKNGERSVRIELLDFSNAQELFSPERALLCLWPSQDSDSENDTLREEVIAVVPRLITKYQCAIDQCGFLTEDEPDLRHHLASRHEIRLHLQLVEDYDEFLKYFGNLVGPTWPREIYLCMHCEKYVSADDTFSYPSDAIYKHLNEEHPREQHSMRKVKTVEEVRQRVITSLPTLYRCRYGDLYVEEKDVNDAWNHYLHAHRNDVVHTEITEESMLLSS